MSHAADRLCPLENFRLLPKEGMSLQAVFPTSQVFPWAGFRDSLASIVTDLIQNWDIRSADNERRQAGQTRRMPLRAQRRRTVAAERRPARGLGTGDTTRRDADRNLARKLPMAIKQQRRLR